MVTERESWVLGNFDAGVTDVSANAQVEAVEGGGGECALLFTFVATLWTSV